MKSFDEELDEDEEEAPPDRDKASTEEEKKDPMKESAVEAPKAASAHAQITTADVSQCKTTQRLLVPDRSIGLSHCRLLLFGLLGIRLCDRRLFGA